MRAGSTVFLGVNVEGALFSIGDGHYRQGEGEACGTAVEGAMTTTLIVELIKGGAPGWPRIEDDTHWMTVGSSRPMEDSWRIANAELVHWVAELYGLHVMDAYQLCSQIAQVPVANVVDANYSVVVKAPKALLPAVDAFDGIHADLVGPRPSSARHHLRKVSPMDLQLNGTRVLVTGGTRGIGRAIVEAFLDEGATVGFCARNADEVAATQASPAGPRQRHRQRRRRRRRRRPRRLGRAVRRARSAASTWSSPTSARSPSPTPRRTGRPASTSTSCTRSAWSARRCPTSSAATPPRSSPSPASPGASPTSPPGPYGTAKTAIVGYINGLALQLADKGIRANTVSPGNTYFEGGVWASIETGNPDLFETAVGLNPTGHMGTPAEIAAPVVFLASPGPAGSAAPTWWQTAP